MPFYNDIMGIAGGLLRSRQEQGAVKIGTVADATRNFASDFEELPNIQAYVNGAADQMDSLAEYVADTSLEDMASDAGEFAKRYPVATLAFAVAAGFGFTRLLLANDRPLQNRRSERRRATYSRVASTKKAKPNGRDTSRASTHGT